MVSMSTGGAFPLELTEPVPSGFEVPRPPSRVSFCFESSAVLGAVLDG